MYLIPIHGKWNKEFLCEMDMTTKNQKKIGERQEEIDPEDYRLEKVPTATTKTRPKRNERRLKYSYQDKTDSKLQRVVVVAV